MSGQPLTKFLVPAVLVVAAGGLVALGFQLRATDAAAMANDRGTEEITIPAAPPVTQPVEPKTDAFTRPMFHRSRQPGPDKAPPLMVDDNSTPPAPDEPESNADSFSLKGVIIGGARARASIVSTDGGDPVWVTVGDDLQGWTVKSISARGVQIRNGDEVAEIKFPDDDK